MLSFAAHRSLFCAAAAAPNTELPPDARGGHHARYHAIKVRLPSTVPHCASSSTTSRLGITWHGGTARHELVFSCSLVVHRSRSPPTVRSGTHTHQSAVQWCCTPHCLSEGPLSMGASTLLRTSLQRRSGGTVLVLAAFQVCVRVKFVIQSVLWCDFRRICVSERTKRHRDQQCMASHTSFASPLRFQRFRSAHDQMRRADAHS